jgi:hypothetical protein
MLSLPGIQQLSVPQQAGAYEQILECADIANPFLPRLCKSAALGSLRD